MSSRVDFPVLLRTKFHRPRMVADLIPRPELKERLDCVWDRPLVLVSAPAGFGKSTLLSAWLDASNRPSAWISWTRTTTTWACFWPTSWARPAGSFQMG